MVNNNGILGRRTMPVPNMDGYFVRELNALEAEEIAGCLAREFAPEALPGALLCALSLHDAAGNRIFADSSEETLDHILEDMSHLTFQAIVDAAMEVNAPSSDP